MSDEQIQETTQSMADIASEVTPVESKTVEQAPTTPIQDFEQFAAKINELSEKVETTSQKTAELADGRQQEMLSKEITEAVGKINENVGGDADMAELFLEKQYRENPDLKKVWDNRYENPEALNKALDLLGSEWAAKNVNVIDPNVAENQRALKESQKGGATVQVDSLHQELDKMDSGEFLNYTQRLIQSG
ncbi:MAG: hypothetical protein ACR2QW_11465 [bacterium]